MHVEPDLVRLHPKLLGHHSFDLRQHAPQPRHVALREVPQTRNISSLHQTQQPQGLPVPSVPVHVRQQHPPLPRTVRIRAADMAVQHVLRLAGTVENVAHPAHALLLLAAPRAARDEGSGALAVDSGRLSHGAQALRRVLAQVLLAGGVDEGEAEGGDGCGVGGTAGGWRWGLCGWSIWRCLGVRSWGGCP